MLIGPSKQEAAATLNLLIKHLCIWGWEMQSLQPQSDFYRSSDMEHVKIFLLLFLFLFFFFFAALGFELRVSCFLERHCITWAIPPPSKVKNKLLNLVPITKKEMQCLIELFWFWKQHISHSSVLLWPFHQMTWRARFEWDPDRTREDSATGPNFCASCSASWANWSTRFGGAWSVHGK
jgi:hypothetical protein